ncbi:N-acetylglucosamine kinase [Pseudarthrobacter sp. J1738]|uniref:N-acetylglucosamine kinase n=1 Tax=unclassified Pseudarthrobacter TaxID=2647000 RepID=UPI003D2D1084
MATGTDSSTGLDAAIGVGAAIGLDIGGTKTRGIRIEHGAVLADETVGSSNVQNVTREEAAKNIAELLNKIGTAGVTAVYAGAGGVDTQEDKDALAALISPHVPGAKITVVHDSRLLLAAGQAQTGVAVIAGTGSAAWGTNPQGQEARAGGWGYLLGDEGSGYWLGREAVRYSLTRMNQGQEPDELTRALLASVGLETPDQLIAHFHSPETGRRYWAQQARVVVDTADAGHAPSAAILTQAAADLAGLAIGVLSQLGIAGPVILGSGLGQNVKQIQDGFRAGLNAAGYSEVRILDQEPIFGTLELLKNS